MDTRLLIFRFSTKATENSATHTRHTWRVSKFHIFTSRMHCYATWDTFVFPSSERYKMIWEAHYSGVVGHFEVEKIAEVLQKYLWQVIFAALLRTLIGKLIEC